MMQVLGQTAWNKDERGDTLFPYIKKAPAIFADSSEVIAGNYATLIGNSASVTVAINQAEFTETLFRSIY